MRNRDDQPPRRQDRQGHQGAMDLRPSTRSRIRHSAFRIPHSAQREVILALLLLHCYGFFHQLPAWNENSRYDLVRALVDDHTSRIDPYHKNTGDKSFYNGHYYSDKAPGSALLAVPAYWLLDRAAALAGDDHPDEGRAIHALTFAAAGLPTVLLALLLLRLLRPLTGERWALTMSLGYALGSLAFPFATMYFGHAAAAFFLFAAFYVLWRHTPSRSRATVWWVIWAGFLAGWAVLVEIPALLSVGPLLLYALARERRAPALMAVGALLPLTCLLAYNWASFGGPFVLGYASLDHSGFAEGMSRGILGVTWPKPAALEEILLGPRGLLRLSPWLSLAPLGLWAAKGGGTADGGRRQDLRREVALCGAIGGVFLLANAGYYLPLGGWSPGPRFLIPALPFVTVLVALAPRAFRPLLGLQIAYAVGIFFLATATMPNAPETVQDPLGDLWLPRLLARDLVQTTAWLRWGLHGAQPLLPLGLAFAIAVAALYATTRPGAAARRLAGVGAGVLAALTLSLGTPLDLAGGLGLARGVAPAGTGIAIVDAGVTRLPVANERPQAELWAQMENRGGELGGTMVIFSIYAPSGELVWEAFHGRVDWDVGERKGLGVQWSTGDAAAGEYRLGVAVMSADWQVTFIRVDNAGCVRVRP